MTPLQITLIILLCTIIAFLSGKIPFSIISAGIILALILTGVMKPAEALSGFINTNVVMFVAMFVIGAALLVHAALSVILRFLGLVDVCCQPAWDECVRAGKIRPRNGGT